MLYNVYRTAGRSLVFLFFLIITASPGTAVSITEFCPDTNLPGDPDEFILLSGEGLLQGVTLSDKEGTLAFPRGARVNGSVVIARNATAYRTVHGKLPDYEWEPSDPAVPDMSRTGRFQMANREDELILLENGVVVETVTWPGDVVRREGQVHYRGTGDWDPRVLMIGQSRIAPRVFDDVSATLFLSPDCGRPLLLSFIHEARRELLVNVYECTDPEIGDALALAAARGVAVTLLLEGGPVGGMPEEEKKLASQLVQSGISVRVMTGSGASRAPYRFDHAKYIVADGSMVLVTSENFKESGFPVCGAPGNRGWGVVLRSPHTATFFRDLFWSDSRGPGVKAWETDRLQALAQSRQEVDVSARATRGGECTPCSRDITGVRVTPVISPDGSDAVVHLLRRARQSLAIEQAYIRMDRNREPNPFLAEVLNASRRGVTVRVLLDSSWFNTAGEMDNDEMAAWINTLAGKEGLPVEARCHDLSAAGILKIHTKGVIVDEEESLISSINWNTNSPTFNREAGVVLAHPEAARYYLAAFDRDWSAAGQTGRPLTTGDSKGPQLSKACLAAVVVLAIAGYYYFRRKRGG